MGSLAALRRGSMGTVVLVFSVLSLLLVLLLFIVDLILNARAFPAELVVVAGLAVFFMFLQWAISPAIVRHAIREREPVTAKSHPWLYEAVEELARQAGVPRPKIWIAGNPGPNAFVFGRTPRRSELVVTQSLLERLNKDEIRAVLAHEVGHLRHRDVIVMTWVSAVPLLAYVLARVGFEVLRTTGRGGGRGKGKGQVLLIALVVAVLSYCVYLITQLLVLHLSRTREYYADAYSAAATRDPHLLASALTKIAYGLSLARKDSEPSGLRAFFIGDPVKAYKDYTTLQERMTQYDIDRDGQIDAYELRKALEGEKRDSWRRANELFATHPATYKRILALEAFEEEMKRSGLPANIYAFV